MEKNKILVVDDDVKILSLIVRLLNREGYRVVSAASGQAACEMLKMGKPDLIIADLILPDMNGGEIIQFVQVEQGIDVPVLFLTGMISKEEETENHLSINVREKRYPAIAKPFAEEEFLRLVKEQLQ